VGIDFNQTLAASKTLLRSAGLLLLGCLYIATLSVASQLKQSFPQYVSTPGQVARAPESRNDYCPNKDGYLWTIMEGSVVRFDRSSLTAFNSDNTPGSGQNSSPLCSWTHLGDLWIATDNGLVAAQPWTFFRYTTADGLSEKHRLQVSEDTDGICGLRQRRDLFVFERDIFRRMQETGPPQHQHRQCLWARDGSIWIVSGSGVSRFNGEKFILQDR